MKHLKSIACWVGIAGACLVASGLGYVYGQNSVEGQFSDRRAVEIFRALSRYDGEISRNDCEGEIVKVNDFVSSYLDRSFVIGTSSSRRFECDGSSLLRCRWSFGGGSSNEAWGRILNFEYETELKRIVPGSVSCLDVP
jgi:hypothetical protein